MQQKNGQTDGQKKLLIKVGTHLKIKSIGISHDTFCTAVLKNLFEGLQ